MTATSPDLNGIWTDDFKTRCAYSEGAGPYRIRPSAVAVPKDIDDLVALVKFARDKKSSLIARGAGSGMPGGNVGAGIVVDTRAFGTPLEFTDESHILSGAACTWAAVDELASSRHLRLPPDPSSRAFCTVGGMVAANAAGPRTVRYGSIRDWVDGVELVTPDGEVEWLRRGDHRLTSEATKRFESRVLPGIVAAEESIRTAFPRTSKNSSGYALNHFLDTGDVLDLIIGSEGTLGFITAVELRLDPIPTHKGTMLVVIPDTRCLSESILAIKLHNPSAIELLDSTFLKLANENTRLDIGTAEAVLIVDIERNSVDDLKTEIEITQFDLSGLASKVFTAVTPQEAEKLWEIRHAASPALARLPEHRRSLQIIEDGCVPVELLSEYLEAIKTAAHKASVEIVAFGHAGDGHLHVNALVDTTDPQLERRLGELLMDATEIIARLGGTTCGEHGDGRLRAGTLDAVFGRGVTSFFKQIKNAFDPENIMNPGVILPDLRNPISSLKVGAHAENIPDDVANFLRDVEKTAAWGSPQDWTIPSAT